MPQSLSTVPYSYGCATASPAASPTVATRVRRGVKDYTAVATLLSAAVLFCSDSHVDSTVLEFDSTVPYEYGCVSALPNLVRSMGACFKLASSKLQPSFNQASRNSRGSCLGGSWSSPMYPYTYPYFSTVQYSTVLF